MHLNIRSLPRKLEKLSDYLLGISAKFSLIGLSETWLSADSGFVNIPSYDFVNQDRKGKSGGGVAFYLDEKLEFKIRADLNYNDPDVLEALFIEVFNPHGKNVIAGVLYRAPNNNFQFLILLLVNKTIRKQCFGILMKQTKLNSMTR